RVGGVDLANTGEKEKIYNEYLDTLKKGVYDYIKEDYDPQTQTVVSRQYFSGGVELAKNIDIAMLSDGTAQKAREYIGESGRILEVQGGVEIQTRGTERPSSPVEKQRPLLVPRAFGEKAVIAKANYLEGEKEGARELSLEITGGKTPLEAFKEFISFIDQYKDSENVLLTLRPFIKYVSRFISSLAYRLNDDFEKEIVTPQVLYELSDELKQVYNVISGSVPLDNNQRTKILVNIKESFGKVSDIVILRLLDSFYKDFEFYLTLFGSDISGWEDIRINFVVNSPNMFEINYQGAGLGHVLEVDVISFLGSGSEVKNFAWRKMVKELKFEAFMQEVLVDTEAGYFMYANRPLMREIFTLLVYMEKDVDFLYGVNGKYEDKRERSKKGWKARHFHELGSIRANSPYVSLLKRWGKLVVKERKANVETGEEVITYRPDTRARIEEAFNFVRKNDALSRRVKIKGNLTDEVIDGLLEMYKLFARNDWRKFSFKEMATSEKTPKAEEKPREPYDVKQATRPVYEERLLRETERGLGNDESVPDSVFAPSPKINADDRETGSAQKFRKEKNKEEEQIVFIPFKRNQREYLDRIEPAIEKMRGRGLKERIELFLSEVWPVFLIARADEAAQDDLLSRMREATGLIGGSVGEIFNQLTEKSVNSGANEKEIEGLAKRLRNDQMLRENGIYVHCEVITRTKNTPKREKVKLLTSIAFKIDDIKRYVVNNTSTFILFLGERIDSLDKDVKALGFTYIGDTHGVVLKKAIKAETLRSIIPHLNNAIFVVEEGKSLHPIYPNIRKALKIDYPSNPKGDELERILLSRYESTAIHEQQHTEDELLGVQDSYSGINKRVAQEVSAYLSSIANGDAPFTDFVKVIELYLSYKIGFSFLNDFLGIYERATEDIILEFAARLGIEVTREQLNKSPFDICNRVLSGILDQNSLGFKELAQSVHREVLERQLRGEYFQARVEGLKLERDTNEVPAPNEGETEVAAKPRNNIKDEIMDLIRGAQRKAISTSTEVSNVKNAKIHYRRFYDKLANFKISDLWPKSSVAKAAAILILGFIAHTFYDLPSLKPAENLDLNKINKVNAHFIDGLGQIDLMDTQALPLEHRLNPGESLSRLAFYYYGDVFSYHEIWSANKGKYNLPPLPQDYRSRYDLPYGIYLDVPGASKIEYTVKKGDTLEDLARTFYGHAYGYVRGFTMVRRIAEYNGMNPSDVLPAGKELLIPISDEERKVYEEGISPKQSDTSMLGLGLSRKKRLSQYLIDAGISEHKNLTRLFYENPQISAVLMKDPALRPVYMIGLSEEEGHIGEIESSDEENVDTIGGVDVLNKYTGFVIKDAQRAEEQLKKGKRIIIGVTDKSSEDIISADPSVANGRTTYFPVKGGWWLGIKGSGSNWENMLSMAPLRRNKHSFYGVAFKDEAENAARSRAILKGTGAFTGQFLGYRKLFVIPKLNGDLVRTSEVNFSREGQFISEPVLIYNKVSSPHRVQKIPQLLQTDPGLKRLFKDIRRAFKSSGIIAPRDIKKFLAERFLQLGRTQAIRQNNEVFKKTTHPQDYTFALEILDNEEDAAFEDVVRVIEADELNEYPPYILKFFRQYRVNISEIFSSLVVLYFLDIGLRRYGMSQRIMPNSLTILEGLFKEYFGGLEDRYLQPWITEADNISYEGKEYVISRPLQLFYSLQNLQNFNPTASGDAEKESFEVLLKIQDWLMAEAESRKVIIIPDFTDTAPLEASQMAREEMRRPADKAQEEVSADKIEDALSSYREYYREYMFWSGAIDSSDQMMAASGKAENDKMSLDEAVSAVIEALPSLEGQREQLRDIMSYLGTEWHTPAISYMVRMIKALQDGMITSQQMSDLANAVRNANYESYGILLDRSMLEMQAMNLRTQPIGTSRPLTVEPTIGNFVRATSPLPFEILIYDKREDWFIVRGNEKSVTLKGEHAWNIAHNATVSLHNHPNGMFLPSATDIDSVRNIPSNIIISQSNNRPFILIFNVPEGVTIDEEEHNRRYYELIKEIIEFTRLNDSKRIFDAMVKFFLDSGITEFSIIQPTEEDFSLTINGFLKKHKGKTGFIPNSFVKAGDENPKTADQMMAGDDKKNVGGIDFNPENLELDTKGNMENYKIPDMFKNIDPDSIDGFAPVIFQIVPINNLPLLLGIKEEEGLPTV
ncbi:MAG: LysM peptidoglycan-binding domain-containing protein, partial [Candidatus Omnitrophica bacterium]|nr:LysM peptidoglycan-binding domain-containing protein [Candidatus Omnitrophota bacterium]